MQCNRLTASCQTIDEVRSAKGVQGKKLPRQNLTNIYRYSFDLELHKLKTEVIKLFLMFLREGGAVGGGGHGVEAIVDKEDDAGDCGGIGG